MNVRANDPDVQKAIADEIAREYLPDSGPCAFCDNPVGAAHRVADSIVATVVRMLEVTDDE